MATPIETLLLAQVAAISSATGLPTGAVVMFGTSTVPSGWLLCDGSAVSRTTYSGLFGVISTLYGAGDGSTTFNLPNFTSAFPRGDTPGATGGSDTHTHAVGSYAVGSHTHGPGSYAAASHTHTVPAHTHPLSSAAWAQMFGDSSGTVTGVTHVSVSPTWTRGWTGTLTSPSNPGTASGLAIPLAGATDSAGSGTTGSTAPAVAGTSDPTTPTFTGTSASSSNVPAYTGVAFIIKT